MSLLKAEQLGYIDPLTLGQLNVTGVIHDVANYEARLDYLRQRIGHTKVNLKLIAVSEPARQQLDSLGIPAHAVFLVPNGLDDRGFRDRLRDARGSYVFDAVRRRNGLPSEGAMVLVAARRVEHKGHRDVIHAVKILRDRGRADQMYVAFTGAHIQTAAIGQDRCSAAACSSLAMSCRAWSAYVAAGP